MDRVLIFIGEREISVNSKKIIQAFLFLIGLGILLYLIVTSGIIDNFNIFFRLNIGYFLIAIIFSLLNILIKIYRWYYLSIVFKKPLSWRDSSFITLSSFFMPISLPEKLGIYSRHITWRQNILWVFLMVLSMIFSRWLFESY